uniref:Putative LAGLIDADG homing endonuclease n=1 Tax=Pleurastrosarcina brevispinosa TaxID=163096 RepID=Q8WKX1_9CHLO|nr:putative protein [Chlorosarcina brevispinosa]AIT94637.1 putative LAGLIDADG homing endonuclease [Chlorosarcina brevispinosa]AIT94649.1 putative LAGLIDADG homing endonuclease [Chlorosarcina brevispinosa]
MFNSSPNPPLPPVTICHLPERGPSLSLMRGRELEGYKSSLILNQRQKDLAVGVMLGDASLQTQNRGKTHRLKFQLSAKNDEYANHLCKEFHSLILSDPHFFERVNANNKTVKSISFQTLSHEDFNFLADLFIADRDGKKIKIISPQLVQKHLTPIGLAHWFMDDGGKMDYSLDRGKGLEFHTQSFTLPEVESLVEGLQEKFQLDCWSKKNKGKYIIAVSGKSFERFTEITQDHIIPSMRYKLPTERKKPR